jgi:hypothetical protein
MAASPWDLDVWVRRACEALGPEANVDDVEAFIRIEAALEQPDPEGAARRVHAANSDNAYVSASNGNSMAALNGRDLMAPDNSVRANPERYRKANQYLRKVPGRLRIAQEWRRQKGTKEPETLQVPTSKPISRQSSGKRFARLELD